MKASAERDASNLRTVAEREPLVGAALGVLGDFVPFAVGQALGIQGGGNSLDNTLRIVELVPTEWVLLDIRVHGVERGFGHGLVNMYAEDGTLEAMEAPGDRFLVAVQWHPETRADTGLFAGLVAAATPAPSL